MAHHSLRPHPPLLLSAPDFWHPTGSWRSELGASHPKGKRVAVRVIDYRLDDPGRPGEPEGYRLITTILDPEWVPAAELPALYPQRWELETALDELKTHQRGPGVVLPSRDPDGVRQKIWAHLLVHYAIRTLMHQAALGAEVDPDRLSFTRSLHIARRQVTSQAAFPPRRLARATRQAAAEALRHLLPPRRLRAWPRVVKRKMSNFPLKRDLHRHWPQPDQVARPGRGDPGPNRPWTLRRRLLPCSCSDGTSWPLPSRRCCICCERALSRQTVVMRARRPRPVTVQRSAFAGFCGRQSRSSAFMAAGRRGRADHSQGEVGVELAEGLGGVRAVEPVPPH
jgi:hypothetical protein